MSETATIKLYYGIGEIVYSPQGVDLSNYSSIEKNISRAGKNLGGYNQLVGQGIFSRFRSPMHVSDGTNQQK
jgi:hypothetical protein